MSWLLTQMLYLPCERCGCSRRLSASSRAECEGSSESRVKWERSPLLLGAGSTGSLPWFPLWGALRAARWTQKSDLWRKYWILILIQIFFSFNIKIVILYNNNIKWIVKHYIYISKERCNIKNIYFKIM